MMKHLSLQDLFHVGFILKYTCALTIEMQASMRTFSPVSPSPLCPLRGICWLGNDTLRVSTAQLAEKRRRLCAGLKTKDGLMPHSVMVLQGGEQEQRCCTDTDVLLFRQVGLVWDQRTIQRSFSSRSPSHAVASITWT